MRPLRLFVVACALTTLLVATAACSGESNDASASRPRERASARHKARHQDPGCRFIVASDGKRALSGPKGLEYLTDAVVEPTTCYDKITFTFDQGNNPDMPPGYTVQYRKAPYVQVGGQPLHSSTEGFKAAHAVLVVEFTPASTFATRVPGEPPTRATFVSCSTPRRCTTRRSSSGSTSTRTRPPMSSPTTSSCGSSASTPSDRSPSTRRA